MDHCTNCGKKLDGDREFCTSCGQQVHQVKEATRSRSKRSGAFSKPITAIVIVILIGLLVGGAFYIGGKYSTKKSATESNDSALKKDEKSPDEVKSEPIATQNVVKEKSEESSEAKKESKPEKNDSEAEVEILDIDSAIEELNKLSIRANGRDISLGKWDITKNDGKLLIQADEIPSANLEHIFTLYDQQNLAPIKKWSVEVMHIAQELEKQMQVDWNISVGNDCVAQYPKTLPSVVITQYSGSCGYSIPVLGASSWGDMTLFIDENMMSEDTTDPVFDYIESSSSYLLPHSDAIKLHESELTSFNKDQLRLARNEIFARYGYVFQSNDLQTYFSQKSWYYPDSSYDGSLSAIEEYNVKLIEKMED